MTASSVPVRAPYDMCLCSSDKALTSGCSNYDWSKGGSQVKLLYTDQQSLCREEVRVDGSTKNF